MNQVYKSFFFSGGRIFYFEIKQLNDAEFVHKKWLYQLYVYPLQTNHSLWDKEKYYYTLYALIFLYLISQTFCHTERRNRERLGRLVNFLCILHTIIFCLVWWSFWYSDISDSLVFKKISSWYKACLIGTNDNIKHMFILWTIYPEHFYMQHLVVFFGLRSFRKNVSIF